MIVDPTAKHPWVNVLDHGYVRLIDSMGDDLCIVQAAQASYARESLHYGEREAGILRFLMSEEHGVPFEHAVVKFGMKLPLRLAAQLKKHRMSSWSEHSARYSPMGVDVHQPARFRTRVGRIGNYTFEDMDDTQDAIARSILVQGYNAAIQAYVGLTNMGVAGEQAALVLPTGLYTEVVWTLNMRSLFNVIHLRADSHAQWEVQQYAHAFEELARLRFPDTIDAFIAAGRPKP